MANLPGVLFLAYPQSPIDCDLHMKLPNCIDTRPVNSKMHVIKLIKKPMRLEAGQAGM